MAEFIHARISNPLLSSDFIFSRTEIGRRQAKAVAAFHELSTRVITEKMRQKKERKIEAADRKVFLDILLEDGSLSLEDIREEVDTFMVAGHDSANNAFMWALYVIGRHPEKQRKLQAEIDCVFAGNFECDVTAEHLKTMPYLDMVVREAFRLYPSAPLIARTLDEDCYVDGKLVPKGSDVTLNLYFVQRHPDYWEKPNEFVPERFEESRHSGDGRKKSPFAYVPFAAGPRNCIGQKFAVQEEKIILTRFFRSFDLVCFDRERDVKINPDIVFQIDQKLSYKVEMRTF